jgi:hypothetical protein
MALTVKKSPSQTLSVLFFNVYNEEGGLEAARPAASRADSAVFTPGKSTPSQGRGTFSRPIK